MAENDGYRTESDSLGEIAVPEDALWGAQTQRAVENFPISGETMSRRFIGALGCVKRAAANANAALGLLADDRAAAIAAAAAEVEDGVHDDQFPVDVFQTGSGTSTNMNANEVIAARAEVLGDQSVHPNDHVNFGQSSNDVIPTAMHIAVVEAVTEELVPALQTLETTFEERAGAFAEVVKPGRTHLQDATPVRLGQEFGGYATQIKKARSRIDARLGEVRELPLGGTATGTGLNTHPEFPRHAIERINEATNGLYSEATDHFELQAAHDGIDALHGALETTAAAMNKQANDLRLLASGPRAGFNELDQPKTQPGSSIMPGKINPVVPEAVNQVHKQVLGNDTTVSAAASRGELELNLYKPLLAERTLDSIELLANAATVFAERFVADLEANETHCVDHAERTLALATALSPHIGYDHASRLAHQALEEGKTIREVAIESGAVDADAVDRILDPARMTERGILDVSEPGD